MCALVVLCCGAGLVPSEAKQESGVLTSCSTLPTPRVSGPAEGLSPPLWAQIRHVPSSVLPKKFRALPITSESVSSTASESTSFTSCPSPSRTASTPSSDGNSSVTSGHSLGWYGVIIGSTLGGVGVILCAVIALFLFLLHRQLKAQLGKEVRQLLLE